MTQIIQQLGKDLKEDLKKAREIWVAVAMVSNKGLEFLTKAATDAKVNIVVGVDLPTPTDVLQELFRLEKTSNTWKVWLKDKGYFHPKVYIVKFSNGKYAAYVGSGNLTGGGLQEHHEVAVRTTDQKACATLINIFHEYCKPGESIKLTPEWLEEYKANFVLKSDWIRKSESQNEELKTSARELAKASMDKEKDFIKELKKFRKSAQYEERRKTRLKAVKEIKQSLDYDNDFKNPDLNYFFSIDPLGKLREINKSHIIEKLKDFRKTLRMLVDESIDLAERYQSAVVKGGDYKIEGAAQALISKVLTAHDPHQYFVANSRSDLVFKEFGIRLPKGLDEGQKYKVMASFLREACDQANIKNFAVLDDFIYDLSERFKD
ncbi:HKD family nuclease [Algoriphagus faecimaris]|uniref:HKD family nuclease n=1 Tax=Algoriphagus faecimaris TaxID=686796 RepID=A0A1G6TXR6_9BACT|nr:phospholipase D-like domain-containing protein [Algoriphagus faecimaris]SDD33962.1 HKD family nuclease [Algoriphagus faecimaris]